jgi:hypothetical protein
MPGVVNKPALQAIIASLTGLSAPATEWGLDPNAFVGDMDRANVQITIERIEALGVDEHRRVLGPPGYPATTFVTTEIGQREIHINLYAECYDYSVEAAELIDLVRTSIRADAVTAQLNAINLAFEWMSTTTPIRQVRNERALNAASADIRFGGINSVVSTQDNTGWIDNINGPKNIVPGTFT